MTGQDIRELKDDLEAAPELDQGLAGRMSSLLGGGEAVAGRLMQGTDETIHVAGEHFPGWAITFDGYASTRSNSSWKCTLREVRGPDDDQIVGIGTASSMGLALLAAIAHIHAMRARGYA